MPTDAQGLLSNKQAIIADAASTNYINLLKAHDLGTSDIPMYCQVVEDFNNATSLTLVVQEANNADFSDATVIAQSAAIALASLKVGYVFPINFIPKTSKKYIRAFYDVTGTAPTTGKVTTVLGAKAQTNMRS